MDATDWTGYDAEPGEPWSEADERLRPIRFLGGADLAFVREWLACEVTEGDLHDLAGVPLGARLTVSGTGRGLLSFAAVGQCRLLDRSGKSVVAKYQTLTRAPLSVRAGGTKAQVLQFCYATSTPGRTGFATDAVARMVAGCERIGLPRIVAVLAGDAHDAADTSSGYHAWVTQGFDARLDEWPDLATRPLPEELRWKADGNLVTTVLELIQVPGGRDWWKSNGSTVEGEFRIHRRDPCWERLEEAVEELISLRRGA